MIYIRVNTKKTYEDGDHLTVLKIWAIFCAINTKKTYDDGDYLGGFWFLIYLYLCFITINKYIYNFGVV